MKTCLRAVIYTRSSGLKSKLASHHLPGDTIRAYGAPLIRFYFYLRHKTSLKDCQLVVFITCVLLLPIVLSPSKKLNGAVMFTWIPGD